MNKDDPFIETALAMVENFDFIVRCRKCGEERVLSTVSEAIRLTCEESQKIYDRVKDVGMGMALHACITKEKLAS